MKKFVSVLLAVVMLFSLSSVAFAADAESFLPFSNSAFFEYGDYSVHYRTYEPEGGAKNQIMLLHGFGLSTASFEGLAQQYASAGYRVVTVDFPNFGYSSRESKSTQLVDREQLISLLMDKLGGTWILGGHSMGGGVAINVAVENPETVTGLVLFAPQTSTEIQFPLTLVVTSPAVLTIFETLITFASHSPCVIRKLVEMSFGDADYAAEYDTAKIADPLKIKGTGKGMAIMASHAKETDLSKFSSLELPTVIVTASNDKIAAAENLSNIIEAAPEAATVVNLESGGHMMMEYSPEEAAQATLGTISACK